MKRSHLLWALAVINAMLLVGLSWKLGGENTARANFAGGDYLMLPGRVPGFSNGMVYLIETREKVLVPFYFDNNKKEIVVGDPVDLARIFNQPGLTNPNDKRPPRRP
jgi:hypothetical protein